MAILLVVGAHANIERLAGGFIGVDVFFVLSGYLITGLLLQELAATRRIRLTEFYARRFRRLLPGLLLMLVCVFALGSLLLPLAEQPGQAAAGAAAALWASNLYFAFSELDYFAADWDANLFLHTWSLGVEEQFYLLWPVLLALLLNASRHSSGPIDARRLRRWLLALFAASLIACIALTPIAPRFAFYMMPPRAWQFALGALVFLQFGAPRGRLGGEAASLGASSRGSSWIGWLGLGLILGTAALLGDRVAYPGAWAVLPALGTAAVLATSAGATTGVNRLLAWRPLQEIGRLSYAWYLWHWPVLLLGAAVMDVSGAANRFGLVLLSFVFAYLSTRFVEAPIRASTRLLARPGAALCAAASIVIVPVALAALWHADAERRMESFDASYLERPRFRMPSIYRLGCDDQLSVEVRPCSFGDDNAPNIAVAMGDSIGLQWFPAMQRMFDKPGWRLVVMTKSACPMVDAPIFYSRLGREFSECAQWRDAALAEAVKLKPAAVIMGSSAAYEYTEDEWREGTARVLERLGPAARRVFVLRGTPMLPFDGPSCALPRTRLQQMFNNDPDCTAPAQSLRGDEVAGFLRHAAARFGNVTVVDLNEEVCPRGQCRAESNGTLVFRDSQHLAAEFVESIASVFAAHLNVDEKDCGAAGEDRQSSCR